MKNIFKIFSALALFFGLISLICLLVFSENIINDNFLIPYLIFMVSLTIIFAIIAKIALNKLKTKKQEQAEIVKKHEQKIKQLKDEIEEQKLKTILDELKQKQKKYLFYCKYCNTTTDVQKNYCESCGAKLEKRQILEENNNEWIWHKKICHKSKIGLMTI